MIIMALSPEEKQILQEIAGTLSAHIESGQSVASVIVAADKAIKEKLPLHHNNNIIISSIILALQGIKNDNVIYDFLQKLWDAQSQLLVAKGIVACISESKLTYTNNQLRPSAGGLARIKGVLYRVMKDKDDITIKDVTIELSENMKRKKSVMWAIHIAKESLDDGKLIFENENILIDVIIMALQCIKNSKIRRKVMQHMWHHRRRTLIKQVFKNIKDGTYNALYYSLKGISKTVKLSELKDELLTVEEEMKAQKKEKRKAKNTDGGTSNLGSDT